MLGLGGLHSGPLAPADLAFLRSFIRDGTKRPTVAIPRFDIAHIDLKLLGAPGTPGVRHTYTLQPDWRMRVRWKCTWRHSLCGSLLPRIVIEQPLPEGLDPDFGARRYPAFRRRVAVGRERQEVVAACPVPPIVMQCTAQKRQCLCGILHKLEEPGRTLEASLSALPNIATAPARQARRGETPFCGQHPLLGAPK